MRPVSSHALAAAVCLAALCPPHVDAQDTLQWSPYVAPTIVTSHDHLLQARVKTGPTTVSLAGKTWPVNLYAGSLFPPVFQVEPGDELRVRLENAMDPSLFSDTAGSHLTNLHFHGFAVSPKQPG